MKPQEAPRVPPPDPDDTAPSGWMRWREVAWHVPRLLSGLGPLGPRGPENGPPALVIPGFLATDRTQFSNVVLPASFGATSLEVGAGAVATLSETISLFAVADYTANVNGPHRQTIEGNLGIRVTW